MSVTFDLTWVDADGELPLDLTEGIAVTYIAGLEAPPRELTTDGTIGGDGVVVDGKRWGPRTVDLILEVFDATRARTRVEELVARFSAGGELRYSDAVHTRSLVGVEYAGGIESAEVPEGTATFAVAPIALLAPDPFWYSDEVNVSLPVTMCTPSSAHVASSGRIPSDGGGPTTITIDGRVNPDGFVTLVGPFDRYTLATDEAGWTMNREFSLDAGETMIVDSRADTYGPRLDGGLTDWQALVTPLSTLFSMPVSGDIVVGAKSGPGASATFSYRPRWLTP